MSRFDDFTNWLFGRGSFEGQEEDEEVVLLIRKHPLLFFRSILPPCLILLAVVAMSGLLVFGRGLDIDGPESALAPLAGLISLAMIGWVVLAYVEWENDQFIVTTQRVIAMRRVYRVSEDRREARLEVIQDVAVSINGTVAYLFNYGDVSVATGSAARVVDLITVPGPMRVKEEILRLMSAIQVERQELRQAAIKERLERELGYRGLDVGNEARR